MRLRLLDTYQLLDYKPWSLESILSCDTITNRSPLHALLCGCGRTSPRIHGSVTAAEYFSSARRNMQDSVHGSNADGIYKPWIDALYCKMLSHASALYKIVTRSGMKQVSTDGTWSLRFASGKHVTATGFVLAYVLHISPDIGGR